ncbi:reprolysin-like metallopeptidase [Flavobacterium sp.]|uniref:zinc-dependent metalloprotease n=1 Tax=Flavobacterium sp. TaxID=239 RepID=UPI0026297B0E|nr:zinc-dependent metalloprotease family protein [Flavobacterium sp.]
MKNILLFLITIVFSGQILAQKNNVWRSADPAAFSNREKIRTGAYSENQKFYTFDVSAIKSQLANVNKRFSADAGVKISIPNVKGEMEEFLVWENSNFEPELQAKFPEIRSYIGRGITDKNAKLYFSLSPEGIQTMTLRADKGSEFIEPYTKDRSLYVLFDSQTRLQNSLPLVCSTADIAVNKNINSSPSVARSNNGSYKTMRLALSCTGEYGIYHGGTVAGALAAMNATMTRVNGVYDIDLAIHLNLIANNNLVVFTNATTDGYSAASNMGNWNGELQAKLTAVIGEANYDIGHLFGATGGGGDAGCIGCVCVNNQKGSGITSPSDGVPMGDSFDIDYVAHEMGHQMGGTHSYSVSYEGSGTNVEPGSGSTIMGYAGITGNTTDVQSNSDDYFTYANIIQIQQNLATKTCPVSTPTANSAPVVNAGADYTIPKGTPFVLTGSASDADNDVLDYTWEQFDDASNATSGNASIASATKVAGPTFRSFSPTAAPIRYFPTMSRILTNSLTSSFESVSNVSRPLNFTLTARDNSINGAQTNTDAMVVTVNAAAGPFAVTAPNSVVSWPAGSNQTVTWNVAGTTANGINAAFVDIYFSSNSGSSFNTLLASHVPNDGSEIVTIPNSPGTSNRIMVKANGNIFFDISNTNFAITSPGATQAISFSGVEGDQYKLVCNGDNPVTYNINYTALGGFSGATTFSATGNPAGSTVNFSPASASATGSVVMTIDNLSTSPAGFYTITVTSTSGAITKTANFYLVLGLGVPTLTSPANLAIGQAPNVTLSWSAATGATSYSIQLATDSSFANIVSTASSNTNSYQTSGLNELTTYYWRVAPLSAECNSNPVYGAPFQFTTGHFVCTTVSSTNVPLTISQNGTPTINSTLNFPANATITDVNVTMQIVHSYVEDITATLISPAATQVQLFSGLCGDANNVNAQFDDSGTPIVCGSGTAISGIRKPANALAAFNGQASNGTWTLRIADGVSGDGGTLNSWSINICTVEIPLGIEGNTLFNFAVYPNPNNGSFNVQSDKLTSDKVDMTVYDIRGRVIFQKDYNGSANFNENIQLNNAEAGIYLLSVSDGQNKEVKRIVVQ